MSKDIQAMIYKRYSNHDIQKINSVKRYSSHDIQKINSVKRYSSYDIQKINSVKRYSSHDIQKLNSVKRYSSYDIQKINSVKRYSSHDIQKIYRNWCNFVTKIELKPSLKKSYQRVWGILLWTFIKQRYEHYNVTISITYNSPCFQIFALPALWVSKSVILLARNH